MAKLASFANPCFIFVAFNPKVGGPKGKNSRFSG